MYVALGPNYAYVVESRITLYAFTASSLLEASSTFWICIIVVSFHSQIVKAASA